MSSVLLAVLGIWVSVQSQGLRFFKTWPGWLVIAGIMLGIAGAVGSLKRNPGEREMQRKIAFLEENLSQARQDLAEQIRDQLYLLAKYGLNYTDHERISVYNHNGRAFVMLGRYSENPDYDKPGRGIYPDNEGCISVAWRNKKEFIDDLPDPATDEATYNKIMNERYNMSRSTMRKVRMKSRSFAAFAIYDAADRDRVAVIVFESTRTNVLQHARLEQIIAAEGKRISYFLERRKSQGPRPSDARKEGF